jgi:hypothetical protein
MLTICVTDRREIRRRKKMPKFIAVIERTQRYYVRLNAPNKKAAELWGNDMDWELAIDGAVPDEENIDAPGIVDPSKEKRLPGSLTKSWLRKAADITVDEEGEEVW